MVKKVLEASQAVAHAIRLCKPDVIAMYPITPQTHIVEKLADFINDGELDSEMIHAESEHSAISACLGTSSAGGRTYTATASQGLALMHEVLHIVSGMRLPIVMNVANRALSAPINIWNDHQDSISARDTGWIQLYVESAQEAFDTSVMAFSIAEDKDVLLPVMVCLDGFTLSHVWEPVEIESASKIKKFVGTYSAKHAFLDPRKPMSQGPIAFPDHYINFRKQQQDAMMKSPATIKKVAKKFKQEFGRKYGDGLLEDYRSSDAKVVVVAMGSMCGTARVAIDELRKEGIKAGLLKVKCFRPFPKEAINKKTEKCRKLLVLDKDISLGNRGVLFTEVKEAVCKQNKVNGMILGLGGKDVTVDLIKDNIKRSLKENFEERWDV